MAIAPGGARTLPFGMGKIAPSPARAGSGPTRQGGGAVLAPARPGRHWSRLAFAPVVQRQPDPKVDYFPEKTRAANLERLLNASPVDVPAVIAEITPIARDKDKVGPVEEAFKAKTGKELDKTIQEKLSGDDRSRVLFLLYAPPAQREGADVTVDKAGKEEHKGQTASGGDVAFNTGVEYTRKAGGEKYPTAFSVSYQGADSKEARFIQFLWTEVLATFPGKQPEAVNDTAISLSGSIELTTDPAKPKRIVDTVGSNAFYDDPGPDIRTAGGTVIFDQPHHSFQVVNRQFDKGATLVVERDHFDDYLVIGYKTAYRVSHVVEWTFTGKETFVRKPIPQGGAAVTALPADVKAVLLKRFPKLAYIQ